VVALRLQTRPQASRGEPRQKCGGSTPLRWVRLKKWAAAKIFCPLKSSWISYSRKQTSGSARAKVEW